MPLKCRNCQLKNARDSKAQKKIKNDQGFNLFDDKPLNSDVNYDSYIVKKYKSHRHIPENISFEIINK